MMLENIDMNYFKPSKLDYTYINMCILMTKTRTGVTVHTR